MKSEQKALAHLQKAMEYIKLGFGDAGNKRKIDHIDDVPPRTSKRSKGISMVGSARAQRIIESHTQGYCMLKHIENVAKDEEITKYFKPTNINNNVQTKDIEKHVTRQKGDGAYVCNNLAQMYIDSSNQEKDPNMKEKEALFSYDLNRSDLIYIDPSGCGFCMCKKVRSEDIAKRSHLPWNVNICPQGYLYLALICMDKPEHPTKFTRSLGSIYLGKGKKGPVCGIVDLIALDQGFEHILLASVDDKVNMYGAMGYRMVDSKDLRPVGI